MRVHSSQLRKITAGSIEMASRLQDDLGSDWIALEYEYPYLDDTERTGPFWYFVRKEEVEIE